MKFLLSQSITFRSKALTIFLGFVVIAIWMISMSHFTTWLLPPTNDDYGSNDGMSEPLRYTIFFSIIWAPLWEELFNRHMYGLIVKQIGNKFLFPAMILSSFIFGWGHGNGQMSMLLQGVSGFIFFYVYAKNGYSYLSSLILHMSWNIFVIFSPTWIW